MVFTTVPCCVAHVMRETQAWSMLSWRSLDTVSLRALKKIPRQPRLFWNITRSKNKQESQLCVKKTIQGCTLKSSIQKPCRVSWRLRRPLLMSAEDTHEIGDSRKGICTRCQCTENTRDHLLQSAAGQPEACRSALHILPQDKLAPVTSYFSSLPSETTAGWGEVKHAGFFLIKLALKFRCFVPSFCF